MAGKATFTALSSGTINVPSATGARRSNVMRIPLRPAVSIADRAAPRTPPGLTAAQQSRA
ncbi:hypothetical protein GCM10011320_51590 [Neoroseomonas lacus]|uniref:Uncharacterized protein n=1 Tax=Neoroseomonas lacus TaxID=287609 RepID=A0A917KZU6_9PROT|nr:hypothetical protein GCM10011320_51590 [Neoroseomonas lacus]